MCENNNKIVWIQFVINWIASDFNLRLLNKSGASSRKHRWKTT